MKTYKAQESVKKPLTALKKRNIKKQRSITIQNTRRFTDGKMQKSKIQKVCEKYNERYALKRA